MITGLGAGCGIGDTLELSTLMWIDSHYDMVVVTSINLFPIFTDSSSVSRDASTLALLPPPPPPSNMHFYQYKVFCLIFYHVFHFAWSKYFQTKTHFPILRRNICLQRSSRHKSKASPISFRCHAVIHMQWQQLAIVNSTLEDPRKMEWNSSCAN